MSRVDPPRALAGRGPWSPPSPISFSEVLTGSAMPDDCRVFQPSSLRVPALARLESLTPEIRKGFDLGSVHVPSCKLRTKLRHC
jgi:hypothetical protein